MCETFEKEDGEGELGGGRFGKLERAVESEMVSEGEALRAATFAVPAATVAAWDCMKADPDGEVKEGGKV